MTSDILSILLLSHLYRTMMYPHGLYYGAGGMCVLSTPARPPPPPPLPMPQAHCPHSPLPPPPLNLFITRRVVV